MSVKQKQQKEPFIWTPNNNSDPSLINKSLPTPEQESVTARPYVCHQCNQAFSRTHNLKSHLTTHSSEKPFQCPTCFQYFRRQHDLKRHQKLHTGERPFKCDKCFRSFARLDALTRHQRSDGGTACNSVHNKRTEQRLTAAIETKQQQEKEHNSRPLIPQISIPNPASKPYPITSSSPLPPTTTTLSPNQQPLTASPTSMDSKQPIFLPPLFQSPPPFRSWSYPNHFTSSSPNNNITLPSLPNHTSFLQEKIRSLELENDSLKQQVKTMSTIKARVHDLEVENNLLKSLIQERNDYKKIKDEQEDDNQEVKRLRTN